MIYDHTSGKHRYVIASKDAEPGIVRLLGDWANYPAAQEYLSGGYQVQLGTPMMLDSPSLVGVLESGDQDSLDLIFDYVDNCPAEYGGWHDITDCDLAMLKVQWMLESKNRESEEVEDALLDLYEFLPVSSFLRPFMFSDLCAAGVLVRLADPRWHVLTSNPDDLMLVYMKMGVSENFKVDESNIGYMMLHQAMFGQSLGEDWEPHPMFLENPFGKIYQRVFDYGLEDCGLASHLIELSGGDDTIPRTRMAKHDSMRRMVEYIVEVWTDVILDRPFDPTQFFDTEEDVKFFQSHI